MEKRQMMFKDYQKSKAELENEVIKQGAKQARTQSRQVEMIEEQQFEIDRGHRRS